MSSDMVMVKVDSVEMTLTDFETLLYSGESVTVQMILPGDEEDE